MTKRTTSTAVSCSPGSVALNEGSCARRPSPTPTAGAKSFPSGSVSFGSDNPGTFAPGTSCTLAQVGATSTSSCSVTYTPTANAGTHKLSGAYSGSATHKISDGGFDLTVTKRTTATAVSCSPGSVALNEGSSCTATVSDTDGGTKSFPSGSVSFGSDNPGTFPRARAARWRRWARPAPPAARSRTRPGQRRHAQALGRLLGLGHAQDL